MKALSAATLSIFLLFILLLGIHPAPCLATAQISDNVLYGAKQYRIIGKTRGDLAKPEDFGMRPTMMNTACYRGFFSLYELTAEGLFLKELTLRTKDDTYLPIAGVTPERGEGFLSSAAIYKGLKVPVRFTGRLRLADGFIRSLYRHRGYQKPYAFETVLDITLKDGATVKVDDLSEKMRTLREAFLKHEKAYKAGEVDEPWSDEYEDAPYNLDNLKE